MNWASKRYVRVKLYNAGFTDEVQDPEIRPCLEVTCREFREVPGVAIRKSWISGGRRVGIDLPRYAIPVSKRVETSQKLDGLVKANFQTLLSELKCGQDEIVSYALSEAARHVDNVSNSSVVLETKLTLV